MGGAPRKRSLIPVWQTLGMPLRTNILGQLVRYGVAGVGVALAYSLIYEAILRVMGAEPELANTGAFLVSVVLGYLVHSRWSFRDHGSRESALRNTSRFFIVNVATFAINCVWVWLIVKQWGLSPHLPLLPILFVMPWFSFWLNRQWTFGER